MACCAVAAYIVLRILTVHNRLSQQLKPLLQSKQSFHLDNGVKPAKSDQCLFEISGMTCSSCTSSIQEALESKTGVHKVNVSLHISQAQVAFDSSKIKPSILAETIEAAGYGARQVAENQSWHSHWTLAQLKKENDLTRCRGDFIQSVSLSVLGFALYFGISRLPIEPSFSLNDLVRKCISLVQGLVCARHLHQEAWISLKHRNLNMSVLASGGLFLALLPRFFIVHPASRQMNLNEALDTALILVPVSQGGRLLKFMVSQSTTSHSKTLVDLLPTSTSFIPAPVWREISSSGKVKEKGALIKHTTLIKTEMLRAGDMVLVQPMQPFPGDGILCDEATKVDEGCITGENCRRLKQPGDFVYAGCTNITKTAVVRIERAGNATWLGMTLKAMAGIESQKAKIQSSIDTVLHYFVAIVISNAATVALIWKLWLGLDWIGSLGFAASVLLCACPCAIGLSVPTCTMLSMATALKKNVILLAGASQIENAGKIRTIIFDKTGTLTNGRLEITKMQLSPQWQKSDCSKRTLWLAVQHIEDSSPHPVGATLRDLATGQLELLRSESETVELSKISKLNLMPGLGIQGLVQIGSSSLNVAIGSRKFFHSVGIDIDSDLGSESTGIVFVGIEGKLAAEIAYSETLRPAAAETVRQLQSQGYDIGIMTGDTLASAARVARSLSIPPENVWASLLPMEKARLIERLEGRPGRGLVAMVGDNLNDVPALARASLGMALAYPNRTGSTHGLQIGADVVILPTGTGTKASGKSVSPHPQSRMDDPLYRIPYVLQLLRATFQKMKLNLVWALVYNLFALLLASGFLQLVLRAVYGEGSMIEGVLFLSPVKASIGMALSSLFILLNSSRLLKFQSDALPGAGKIQ